MHTSLQGQQDIYCHFENGKKKHESLINQYMAKHCI